MVALKTATIEWLKADAALAALVGVKIYDEVPRDDRGDPSDAAAPYLFLGAMRWGDFEIGCNPGLDVVIELHAVSTKFGREECWQIAEAVRHALEWRELTLDGGHLMTPYRRRSGGDAISPLFPKQAYVALRTQLSEALT
jgi:hypothetical protein